MDLSRLALEAITIPEARKLLQLIEGADLIDTVTDEARSLVKTYIEFMVDTELSETASPLCYYARVQNSTMSRKQIKDFIKEYNSLKGDTTIPLSSTSNWMKISFSNIPGDLFIVEVSVRNQDPNSEEFCQLMPRIPAKLLDEDTGVYYHNPRFRCCECTIIVPLILLLLLESHDSVSFILEYSSHVEITGINLISLRY